MEHLRIKHGIHEFEVEGDQDFIQGQLEQFSISIEMYEKMIRELDCNKRSTERREYKNEEAEKEESND